MALNRRTPKYVYDIPYFERMEVCKILDQNDKWEELGGVYMNFDMLTIQTLRREILRGNSPTDELLTKWGHQNHTVLELFILLSKMQHYQAMLLLKPFVDSEYHKLIYEGEQNLCRLFQEKQNFKCSGTNIKNDEVKNNECKKTLKYSNNYNNISANLDFSKPHGNLPDKISFISNKPEDNNNEKKIINEQAIPSNANPRQNNMYRNNAQTLLINKEDNVANISTEKNPKFLKPDSGKEKNMSEISSIAESVGVLPVIIFKELEQATNGWDSSVILGKGGFGTVYKGTWKNTAVAIKRTRNSETDDNHSVQIQQILGELKMLNSYRHDNILPLYGFSIDGEDPCLIYQYMPNGSLEDRLLCRHGTRPLSWPQRLNIATGTARGIQFLHTIGEKPLIHGDIKSANILLDSNFEAKIGDFGLAREGPYNHYTHMKVSSVHGTRPYLPDEFLRHKKFSTKVDTHCFGIVLFELATGLRAFDNQRQQTFLKDLVENTSIDQLSMLMDKKCVPEFQPFWNLIELGKRCVRRKPKERPEMVVVLQELRDMKVIREFPLMLDKARQNSITVSMPYEMQVQPDHISQQKRMSPEFSNANNMRLPTRAVSPIFHPEPLSNATSLEPQKVFNGNAFINNPFLKENDAKKDFEKAKEIANYKIKKETSLPKVVYKDPTVKASDKNCKENPQIQITRIKNQTPAISVSPPSASQSLSVLSEEDNELSMPFTETQPEEDLDYEYTSDIKDFLPLISALGVKNKQDNENEAKNESPEQPEVNTSAKGKLLWILDNSN